MMRKRVTLVIVYLHNRYHMLQLQIKNAGQCSSLQCSSDITETSTVQGIVYNREMVILVAAKHCAPLLQMSIESFDQLLFVMYPFRFKLPG